MRAGAPTGAPTGSGNTPKIIFAHARAQACKALGFFHNLHARRAQKRKCRRRVGLADGIVGAPDIAGA
jgi:hypothetical protein